MPRAFVCSKSPPRVIENRQNQVYALAFAACHPEAALFAESLPSAHRPARPLKLGLNPFARPFPPTRHQKVRSIRR